MNATLSTNQLAEVPAYAELQRTMHDALLQQHPEWLERDGNCPKCDEYDHRFAQLLSSFLTLERTHVHKHLMI